jgi:hypothetical protein
MAQHYGGMGGFSGGRPLSEGDAFEMACERQLGDAIRADKELGEHLWSALANMDWRHDDGHTASYSFRAAGDLVAAIYGQGSDYMTFYCSGPYAVVSDRIAAALAEEGWHPSEDTGE